MHPPTCTAGTRDPYHWLGAPHEWFRGPHQVGATGHWVGPSSKLLFASVLLVLLLVVVLVVVLVVAYRDKIFFSPATLVGAQTRER